MTLIPEWRKAWKLASVQVASIAVLWLALPADTQAAILSAAGVRAESLVGIVGALVIVARLIAQPGPAGKDDEE